MVWPTARVKVTAMSKSMWPASTWPTRVETASASAVGEGDLEAAVGEAERSPQPPGLLDGDARLGRHVGGGVRRVLAEDRELELLGAGTG